MWIANEKIRLEQIALVIEFQRNSIRYPLSLERVV